MSVLVALMLGGGAFTLPQYLAQQLPESRIDVVEIDPALAQIATTYFGYTRPAQVHEYFDDARHFVNTSTSQYDLILVDVYGDGSIPFTFTTAEYGDQIDRLLVDDGTVVVNIISGLAGGPCQAVFSAVDAAYRRNFAYGYYITEQSSLPIRANIVATYSRSSLGTFGLQAVPFTAKVAYSDNRAPVP